MCVIVDANRAHDVFCSPPAPQYVPLLNWLLSGGYLVYGGQLARELMRVEAARKLLLELRRAGIARLQDEATIDAETGRVAASGACTSDDPHVIALARVSGARTICTEDLALMQDLKNRELLPAPAAKIFRDGRRRDHRRLLHHCRGCLGFG